jgi:hypothetical protein
MAGTSCAEQLWHASSRRRFFLRSRWLFILAFCFVTAIRASGATFSATLDRQSMEAGDSATLSLDFEGGKPQNAPDLPNIPNLEISGPSESQSFTVINGQASSKDSLIYRITALKPGEYVIPALQVQIGGKTLTSQPLKLVVAKSDNETLAFLKIVLPKQEVFVGEVFTVEMQAFIREDVLNARNILQSFDSYAGAPLKAEGFSVLKTGHVQARRARVENFNFYVATILTSLSAVKTGSLSIGSIDINLPVQLPAPNQGPRDPFDAFFGRQAVKERQVPLSAPPQALTVLALPRQGVPANFNGAVGTYTLAVSAGPTNVAAGDPITLKIQISGKGALDALALPEQSGWQDFKIYPPTAKVDFTDQLGTQGTKTFEQVVVPQNSDIKTLPPLSFAFFNPEKKSYQTLSQPAIPLIVRPGGTMPTIPAIASKTGNENSQPTQDIVPIKTRLGQIAQATPALLQQRWFIGLQAVPVLVWIGALFWRRRNDELANNPRLRRKRQVAQAVEKGLGELKILASQNKSDEFFATLFRLLQEQLGDVLNVPANSITEAVIEEKLQPKGVPQELLTRLHELFQKCNLARYAPMKNSEELVAIAGQAEAVFAELKELAL